MLVGRFAPSPTGPAHPGTLLSGLLAWLDARRSGAHFVLRLEDLDPVRAKPQWAEQMLQDLDWFGLDWDELVVQSGRAQAHLEALDTLAAQGRLYPCDCSRADIKAAAVRAADGGFVYPGTCRNKALPPGGWWAARSALRVRLDDRATFSVPDLFDGSALGPQRRPGEPQRPALDMGDPVVRRRDGAIAYNLAVVVDDHHAGVNRVVRGHDLQASTPVHLALYEMLRAPVPRYWHHLLLLEVERDNSHRKLAKMHGAVGTPELREHLSAEELCGFLAAAAGLVEPGRRVRPQDLIEDFDPARVRRSDPVVEWTGTELRITELG